MSHFTLGSMRTACAVVRGTSYTLSAVEGMPDSRISYGSVREAPRYGGIHIDPTPSRTGNGMHVAVRPDTPPAPDESRSTDRKRPRYVERLALEAIARQAEVVVQDFTDLLPLIYERLVLDAPQQGQQRPENLELMSDVSDLTATLMRQLRVVTGRTLETERVEGGRDLATRDDTAKPPRTIGTRSPGGS